MAIIVVVSTRPPIGRYAPAMLPLLSASKACSKDFCTPPPYSPARLACTCWNASRRVSATKVTSPQPQVGAVAAAVATGPAARGRKSATEPATCACRLTSFAGLTRTVDAGAVTAPTEAVTGATAIAAAVTRAREAPA